MCDLHSLNLLVTPQISRHDEAVDSESSSGAPRTLRKGDVVSYDEGQMRGIVEGFEGKDDIMVIITPTHADDQPIPSAELHFHVREGKQTQSWHRNDVRLHVPVPAGEIKRVPSTGVEITHFHTGPMTASEYVLPHGDGAIRLEHDIEITNHALGSGLYGFAGATEELIREAREKYDSTPYVVVLKNPLYLQDDLHGTHLTELSKTLQAVAAAFRKQNGNSKDTATIRDWVTKQPELALLTSRLESVIRRSGGEISPDEAQGHVMDSLVAFFTDYYSGAVVVAQPINYLLGRLGYDGVYATDSVNNAFNRGCVAYTVPEGVRRTTKSDRLK